MQTFSSIPFRTKVKLCDSSFWLHLVRHCFCDNRIFIRSKILISEKSDDYSLLTYNFLSYLLLRLSSNNIGAIAVADIKKCGTGHLSCNIWKHTRHLNIYQKYKSNYQTYHCLMISGTGHCTVTQKIYQKFTRSTCQMSGVWHGY